MVGLFRFYGNVVTYGILLAVLSVTIFGSQPVKLKHSHYMKNPYGMADMRGYSNAGHVPLPAMKIGLLGQMGPYMPKQKDTNL